MSDQDFQHPAHRVPGEPPPAGVARSPSQSLLDTVMAETVGMSMHNAVAAQNNMRMLASAAVTAACARIVNTTGTPPPKEQLGSGQGSPKGGGGTGEEGPGPGRVSEPEGSSLSEHSMVEEAELVARQVEAAAEQAATAVAMLESPMINGSGSG